MANARPWTVLEHGALEAVEHNLWCVEGALPHMAFGRRMTVIRNSRGQLILHSPIALDEAAMTELDALGPVAIIVAPSRWHCMDAPAFRLRYPDARLVCPASQADRVKKRVTIDGHVEDLEDDPEVRAEKLDGCDEAVLKVVTDASVSLVFNDAMLNLPDHLPGFAGLVTRLLGSTGGPKVTWIARRGIVSDRIAMAAHLRRLAQTNGLRRIIVSHGALIDENPQAVLRAVADKLAAAG